MAFLLSSTNDFRVKTVQGKCQGGVNSSGHDVPKTRHPLHFTIGIKELIRLIAAYNQIEDAFLMDRFNSSPQMSAHDLELDILRTHVTGNPVQKRLGVGFDGGWATSLDDPSENQSMAIRHESCNLRTDLRRQFIPL
jgi:hypothetical protein